MPRHLQASQELGSVLQLALLPCVYIMYIRLVGFSRFSILSHHLQEVTSQLNWDSQITLCVRKYLVMDSLYTDVPCFVRKALNHPIQDCMRIDW